MKVAYGHEHRVPREYTANLRFRRAILRECRHSESSRRAVMRACEDDPLFFVNTFAYTFDPRGKDRYGATVIPFVAYPYQDRAMRQMIAALGEHDVVIEKSRDMGASYLLDYTFFWSWRFSPAMLSFLLVSRKEEMVDAPGNPKALFQKLDLILDRLPTWMRPPVHRTHMHLQNELTGSTIDGESTNGDVARGDRLTAIGLDEFAAVEQGHRVLASTADATNCRFFNSTPLGTGNAFYEVVTNPDIVKIRMHWTEHPIKAEGLYHDAQGKPRSPWYDRECRRRSPQQIAQELDIDYLGADSQFFDPAHLETLIRDSSSPIVSGELGYDSASCQPGEFVPMEKGRLRLWTSLGVDGRVDTSRVYVVGADIATGTGATNSVLSVWDAESTAKVGEFASASVSPQELARQAVALAKWLSGNTTGRTLLIWEANGPGRLFGDAVLEAGYRNIYYRTNEDRVTKKRTDFPGWWSTKETKLSLLGAYREALHGGQCANFCKESLEECREYVYAASSGAVEHSRARSTPINSDARDNHGDRVIADALGFKGCGEVRQIVEARKKSAVEEHGHTVRARFARHEKAEKERRYW